MFQKKQLTFIIIAIIILAVAGFLAYNLGYFKKQPSIFSQEPEIIQPENPGLFSVLKSPEETRPELKAVFFPTRPQDIVKPENPELFLNFPEETKSLPKIFPKPSFFQKLFFNSDFLNFKTQLAQVFNVSFFSKPVGYIWNRDDRKWYGPYDEPHNFIKWTGVDVYWDPKEEILALDENGIDAYVWNKNDNKWYGPYKQVIKIRDWTGFDANGDNKEDIVVLDENGDKLYVIYDSYKWEGPYNSPASFSTLTALNLGGDLRKELLALDEDRQNAYIWSLDSRQWTGPYHQPLKFTDWTGIDVEGNSEEELVAIDETGKSAYVWNNQEWSGPYDLPGKFITWTGVDAFWDAKKEIVGLVKTSIPRCVLTFSPSTIKEGDSSTASWEYTGEITKAPSTCTGDLGSNPDHQISSGSTVVYPKQSQTCAINVEGPGGKSSCSADINVEPAEPPSPKGGNLGTLTDPGSMSNSLLIEIGAKWINAGLWPKAKGYVDIQQVKSRVKELKDNNFNALINFGISMGEDYILHTFMEPGNNDRWLRGDLTGYYGWLNDVVKNLSFDYKGEPAVIYYQMGTELEGPDWWPASKNGSVEDYAIALRLAYKAMKGFNPKLQLILAGSFQTNMAWGGPGLEGPGRNYYLRVLDELALMESIEQNPKAGNKYKNNPFISNEEYNFLFAKDNYSRYFDAVDFHPSGDEKQDLELPKQASLIFEKLKEKGYPKLPLWITDVNDMTWPECGYPNNNEGAHSRAFAKRYITSRAYGAETFLWTIFVNYPAGDAVAKCTGLIEPSDRLGEAKKRKAFYSYKLIADKIDFKEKTDIIKDGKTNDVFVYKLSGQNQAPVYTAWHYNPSGSSKEKQAQINVGFNKAKITNMVPVDNNGNFKSWTQDAPGGIITLTLTNDPYLIEQISSEISQPGIIKDIKVSSPITPFESEGDLWFSTWADDGNLFLSWGDGAGPNCIKCSGIIKKGDKIEPPGPDYSHHGLAQLKGALPNVSAEVIKRYMPLSDDLNNSKPSSLLFYNNRLYIAIHYPLGNSDAGFIAYSDDYGKTFKYDLNSPWKKNSNFRSLFFINMGKDYELNKDGYVYAFGIGTEWDWDIHGNGKVYLARVPKDKIIDYSAWEYFIGLDNNPKWSKDQQKAISVEGLWTWDQFSAMYHPGIKRYIILTIVHGDEGRLYEALNPWGPWILAGKWFEGQNSEWFGNYQPGIIAKNTGANTFYFTAAGQAPPDPNHPYGNYRFKIGEITMILESATEAKLDMVCRLTGENTQSVGIYGTDLGAMFYQKEFNRYGFLIGDVYVPEGTTPDPNNPPVPSGYNALAWSNDFNADDCIDLKWRTDSNGKITKVFDGVPTGAISIGGKIYAFYMQSEGEQFMEPDKLFTVLIRSDDKGGSFKEVWRKKWENKNQNKYFVNIAPVFGQSPFDKNKEGIYLFTGGGLDLPWRSPIYLAYVDKDKIENLEQYYWWTSGNEWIKNFQNASPLIDNSEWVREFSASWNSYLNKWVLLYFDFSKLKLGGGGELPLYMRTASNPWGTWSEPQTLMDGNQLQPWYEKPSWKQPYAPYLLKELFKENGRIMYFTMSLFDPYAIFLMKFETVEPMQKSETPEKTESPQPQEQSKSEGANGAIKSLKNKIRFFFKEN